jgi:hypothetical protein
MGLVAAARPWTLPSILNNRYAALLEPDILAKIAPLYALCGCY